MSTKRELMRTHALVPKAPPSVIVECDGVQYEVRKATLRARDEIMKRCGAYNLDEKSIEALERGEKSDSVSKLDFLKFQIWAAIFCTFVPRDEAEIAAGVPSERVFEESDFSALVDDNYPGSPGEKCGEVASKLLNASGNVEEAKKS